MPTAWVFDLDNTLYPASTGLVAQGNHGILRFLMARYSVDEDGARAVQRRLCADHGTTLRGLMVTEDVDPAEFLAFEEDLDYSVLGPDHTLAAALGALPGRRFVMTNGSQAHARRSLDALGTTSLFEGVWGVDSGDFTPKPWRQSYEQCFAAHAIDPVGAVFVDDLAHNLAEPKALGMTTVHVVTDVVTDGEDAGVRPVHVDHATSDLAGWLTMFSTDQCA